MPADPCDNWNIRWQRTSGGHCRSSRQHQSPYLAYTNTSKHCCAGRSYKRHAHCLFVFLTCVQRSRSSLQLRPKAACGLQTTGVRMLGLTGIGGIGKTTLARAFFHHQTSSSDLIAERACFVSDIQTAWESHIGPQRLQRKILKYLAHHDVEPVDTEEGESTYGPDC